jgi:hypothetical protein
MRDGRGVEEDVGWKWKRSGSGYFLLLKTGLVRIGAWRPVGSDVVIPMVMTLFSLSSLGSSHSATSRGGKGDTSLLGVGCGSLEWE